MNFQRVDMQSFGTSPYLQGPTMIIVLDNGQTLFYIYAGLLPLGVISTKAVDDLTTIIFRGFGLFWCAMKSRQKKFSQLTNLVWIQCHKKEMKVTKCQFATKVLKNRYAISLRGVFCIPTLPPKINHDCLLGQIIAIFFFQYACLVWLGGH